MANNGNKASLAYNRNSFSVLVVCARGDRSNQVRGALKTLGFTQISAAPSHVTGMDRFKSRPFTHIFFDALSTDMPALEFVKAVAEIDQNCTMIAISEEPKVDDVFGLLRAGAKHFLVTPFAVDSLEDVLISASEGPPLSDAVLNAPDRNTALAGVVLNALYRQTVLMRQAREFATAARELELQTQKLMQTIDMARIFCEGSEENLLAEIVEACIQRANLAASRLGRTRKKLQSRRGGADGLDGDEEEAATA
jgi:PleD family two-component response regulator